MAVAGGRRAGRSWSGAVPSGSVRVQSSARWTGRGAVRGRSRSSGGFRGASGCTPMHAGQEVDAPSGAQALRPRRRRSAKFDQRPATASAWPSISSGPRGRSGHAPRPGPCRCGRESRRRVEAAPQRGRRERRPSTPRSRRRWSRSKTAIVETSPGRRRDRVERVVERRERDGDHRVAPVEEPVAVRPDDDVAAVEVVVLDGGGDAGSSRARPARSGSRAAPRDAGGPGRRRPRCSLGRVDPAPDPSRRREPIQRPASRSGRSSGAPAASIAATTACALERPLQVGVLGRGSAPRRAEVVIAGRPAGWHGGRPCVVEQEPRPGRVDGERQHDARSTPAAPEDLEERTLVRGTGTGRLEPDGAAIGRDAHRRRPRPHVRLLDRARDPAAEARQLSRRPSRRPCLPDRIEPGPDPGRDRLAIRSPAPRQRPLPPPNRVPKTPRIRSWPSRELTTLPPVRMAVSIVFC